MNKITVTHLAYSVNYQTAAYRLHKSLLDAKVNSNMLVGSKSIIDSDIVQPKTMIEKLSALSGLLREVIYKKIINHNNSPYFSINNTACIIQKKWLNKIVNISPDIVHLHWIGNGFIPLNYLDKSSWSWVDGSTVTYSNWRAGQPDKGFDSDRYVAINYQGGSNNQWDNFPNKSNYMFRGIYEVNPDT